MEPQEHLRRCREFYNGSVAMLEVCSMETQLKRHDARLHNIACST